MRLLPWTGWQWRYQVSWPKRFEPAYIFDTIAEGRAKGALRMPSWRGVLTDDQIWQATAYVMSISHP